MTERGGDRVETLFEEHIEAMRAKVDRSMAALMVCQYLFAIGVALVFSPYAWAGKVKAVHAHVYVAVVLGAVVSSLPIALALLRPGKAITRYVIASAQMLWSALLIHLMGGRIEAHFHVFGSLAFLAFYRDWKVLVPATVIVALDHFTRQMLWPESVFGVSNPEWWRFLEHAFWVVFEDVFLVLACLRGTAEVRDIAQKRAALEDASRKDRERAVQLDALLSETIEAKNAAERANEIKGQFLANMSHELRTPINGVLGMLELLERTSLESKQRHYVDSARSSGEGLLLVVNDILDFSKVDAGKLALQEVVFAPADVAQAVVDLFAEPAQRKGLELLCDLTPDVGKRACGDPGRLRQVLNNLVANAVKFTERGQVLVRGRLAAGPPDRLVVRFEVEDSGIGIPEDQRAKVFDAFAQVDASNTRKYGGTGLGLSIAKQLVQMMGGEIGLEPRAGGGTTFWFTVSLAQPDARGRIESEPDALLREARILVVDDNATNREILRGQLERWVRAIVCVPDGARAIEAFERAREDGHPFSLVIVDMQMPEMDGIEVARALHAREQRPTPILMLTSVIEPDMPEHVTLAGIAECLTKPVHAGRLKQRMLAVLGAADRRPTAERGGRSSWSRTTPSIKRSCARCSPSWATRSSWSRTASSRSRPQPTPTSPSS